MSKTTTALDCLKHELRVTQQLQMECVDPSGFVKTGFRHEYQERMERIVEIKKQIEWWENLETSPKKGKK